MDLVWKFAQNFWWSKTTSTSGRFEKNVLDQIWNGFFCRLMFPQKMHHYYNENRRHREREEASSSGHLCELCASVLCVQYCQFRKLLMSMPRVGGQNGAFVHVWNNSAISKWIPHDFGSFITCHKHRDVTASNRRSRLISNASHERNSTLLVHTLALQGGWDGQGARYLRRKCLASRMKSKTNKIRFKIYNGHFPDQDLKSSEIIQKFRRFFNFYFSTL